MKKLLYFSLTLFLSLLIFSCKTTSILKTKETDKTYIIQEINLEEPDLEIISYPKSQEWEKGLSIKKFARKNNCFAASNANPFKAKSNLNLFSNQKAVGIYIDNYTVYSEALPQYSGIAFYREEKGYSAKIFDTQTGINSTGAAFAFGGFWTILKEEKIYNFKDIKDFRTVLGLSKDGKIIYLMYAEKMSYMDCALILKEMNVDTALQMDGGNSSQVFINDKSFHKKGLKRNPSVILGFTKKSLLKN